MKRYELHEQLGEGGMGIVYRASDRLTSKQVALKQVVVSPKQLLFNSRKNNVNARLALAREFETLASLRHPHIISVLDNLLKGASGQAVQNMNIMFGLPESTGLNLKGTAF